MQYIGGQVENLFEDMAKQAKGDLGGVGRAGAAGQPQVGNVEAGGMTARTETKGKTRETELMTLMAQRFDSCEYIVFDNDLVYFKVMAGFIRGTFKRHFNIKQWMGLSTIVTTLICSRNIQTRHNTRRGIVYRDF